MKAHLSEAQCIEISSRTLLITLPDGRSWLTELGSTAVTALPVSAIAARRSSLAAGVVEGAIAAGLTRTARASADEPCSLLRYIRWLVGNHAFAGQTPGLLRRAAERFDALGRGDLAGFSRQKAAEEEGHADLAYRDLEAFGLPAAQVVRLIRPPSADAFAGRLRAYVESSDPIAVFGFSYCLERMAVERDHAFVRKTQAICPPGVRAFRFLKVHSNVGSDGAHAEEQLSLFESLSHSELKTVACAAFETAELLARQQLLDQTLSDEEIAGRLQRAGITVPKEERQSEGHLDTA
jgi:hypothetical protein